MIDDSLTVKLFRLLE